MDQPTPDESLPPGADEPVVASSEAAAARAAGEGGTPRPRRRRRWARVLWRAWSRPLMLIGIVMFSFRSAVADWNDVPTGSMKPTILEGDRIFINKVAYDLKLPFTMMQLMAWDDPAWGDIVVLRSPEDGTRLVKRVIGLPGDRIEVRHGFLFVNGEPADYERLDQTVVEWIDDQEQGSYLFVSEVVGGRDHPMMLTRSRSGDSYFGPYEVPPGHFFVMGDNRDNSRDSRRFGPVSRDLILGRATAVALSVDPSQYYLPRWDRFFSKLE